MAQHYNPPPNWPTPPTGWTPPPGWQPDPAWGPPPAGWQLWTEHAPALPPVPAPPVAPRKGWFARHKVLTAIGAVVVLLVVIGAINGGGDKDTPDAAAQITQGASPSAKVAEPAAEGEAPEPTEESIAAEEPIPAIGDPVRDGKFEFVVTGVECGETIVGNEFLNKTAQGNFCFVALSVTNIGDEPQTFFADNQDLYNEKDQKYSPDTSAVLYMDDAPWFDEINPDNALTGRIAYDVPVGTVPARIELHDSMFSGGVEVKLN